MLMHTYCTFELIEYYLCMEWTDTVRLQWHSSAIYLVVTRLRYKINNINLCKFTMAIFLVKYVLFFYYSE